MLDCTDVCDAVMSRLKGLGYSFSDNEDHGEVLDAFAEVTLVPDKDFEKLLAVARGALGYLRALPQDARPDEAWFKPLEEVVKKTGEVGVNHA